MDKRPPPIDDTTLHAWVDGQLPRDEAERVARALVEQPDAAAQVADWQAQRDGLRALHAGLLDQPVPARLLTALAPPAEPSPHRLAVAVERTGRWPIAWAASVVLAAGIGLGWTARGWQPGADLSVSRVAVQAVPGFVRDAGAAHVLYVPEQRHPVEVGAEQQQHLVQWLSKRLGQRLRVPVLVEQGWTLVGGRLLPAGVSDGAHTGGDGAALARAQFMYEAAGGARLTLYVAVAADAAATADGATAFRLGHVAAGAAGQAVPRSLYWVDGPLGYALTGTLSAEALTVLARQVHQQLTG